MDTNHIFVQNAHANNLKNIDLRIPKHKLVVFTGISGSGKSSLLFDTIYTEAQRQLIETFSTFSRTRMPKLSRPDVDDIQNLSTTIVIDQRRLGRNLRSTVGTVTEVNTYLRLLYSRSGKPWIGPSFLFSFNHPEGMCPQCKGLGKRIRIDTDLFLDKTKSIRDGGITHPNYKPGGYLWQELMSLDIVDTEKPLGLLSSKELNLLLYSEPFRVKDTHEKLTYSRNFEGIARKLENSISVKADGELAEEEKDAYAKYYLYESCEACGGSRLNERAGSVKLNGLSIDELCRMELTDVLSFLADFTDALSKPILAKARFLLQQLIEIGVGYLSLDRAVGTLSGGESQRVKMAKQLDCNLVDMFYVLDEPSIGLHPRDTEKLLKMLFQLKDKGNSIFIVEHDPDIIKAAEWIVDMGPKAGKEGGNIVYNGEPEGLAKTDSITGKYLYAYKEVHHVSKIPDSFFEIKNASANNLKSVYAKIPKGVLTCVTGVAGSGKSSLIHDCFARQHPEAIVVHQAQIGRSSRANIVTFIGVFDLIRKEFAAATKSEMSLFSFNSKGACHKCNGQGTLSFELHFMDAVKTVCDECKGKRYHADVLEKRYCGKNIADVLEMTAVQAIDFFDSTQINKHLHILLDAGLHYLKLGQSLSSLSGGESQRLKIANELKKESNIYIMDEPTTGLHMSDVEVFYKIIESLVAKENTVIIIEHNLEIIKYADWIIDLGPEGGKAGGRIVFQGSPEEAVHCKESYTGKCLEKYLSRRETNPACESKY